MIKLMQRESGSDASFTDTGISIPFEDTAMWTWSGAEAGMTYDLRADVSYKNAFIKSSTIASTTAPSTGVALRVSILATDIPDYIIEQTLVPISGSVQLNGYVPGGSLVKIFAREEGTQGDFIPVVNNLTAQNGAKWVWDTATAGTSYEMQAEMYTSTGTFIGESVYVVIAAPAQNEKFVINSTAVPPVSKATISGTVKVNGPIVQGSTVLLLQRKSGTSEYTEFQRLPAQSQVSFTWNNAASGSIYDIQAALQVNEQNSSTSNTATITAPASSLKLELNTNNSVSAPTQLPQISCGSPDATGGHNVTISYPNVSQAKQYWIEAGTQPGLRDIFGEVVPAASNQSVDKNVYLKSDTNSYTRYAYSMCSDCKVDDLQNWSGFSPTLGFRCTAGVPTLY